MMHRLLNFFKRKGLAITIFLLTGLIVVYSGLFLYSVYIGGVQRKAAKLNAIIEPHLRKLQSNVVDVDIKGRDAMIYRSQSDLAGYSKYLDVIENNLDSIKYNAHKYEISTELISPLEVSINLFLSAHRNFLGVVQASDSSAIATHFGELPLGKDTIVGLLENIRSNLEGKIDEGGNSARLTQRFMKYVFIGIIIGIPFFIWAGLTLIRARKRLAQLNHAIYESNQKYVFHTHQEIDFEDTEQIKTSLLTNLKKAADFIKSISNGNYDVRWEGMDETNRDLNKENIAGELILMREQMKKVKEQDEARIWATEGLSKFGELIRKQQDDFGSLADTLISNVVKYVKAKVGGLFILEEEEGGASYLELKACYAYDRKKYVSKRLEIGEGLVGQAYMEGLTVYLTEVPDEYMVITSGLGETNPRSLLIIPLRTNERIEGILELASLNEFKPYEIEFLEKLGETLASSIVTVRTAEKTKILLQLSQEQGEEMRAQEEEMRQNMEELEATQEQMNRHVNELNILKESLEEEKYLFNALMENMPDAIYYKDLDSKFIRVSKYLANHFNAEEDALIGKSDFDFQDEVHATEAYNDEQNIIKTRKGKYDYVEREVLADGSVHYVSTTKLPLVNLHGKVVGTFGVSRDVTKMKLLEIETEEKTKQLRKEEEEFAKKSALLQEKIEEQARQIEQLKKGK